ncbi:LysR family transcriptional regulator [Curvibacter sp. HBC28]|uniref:LysR family transcriptional regulator n=1 Tax=Curvibacter microcysteis TaxID=3026419 RepID=A0ABT5MGY1_9BURK|nr:LysR family transcriptional regulator [Curvibacter sp. HBC28]MDD0815254.1 LysR family transcriptional regulator [Curvibacter sp. HBC28]
MLKSDWDLVDLQVFCQAARRASFAQAALDLGISGAYVTKRIAHLEKALGVRLFHRSTRRVVISEAGEAAYTWARRVLDSAAEWGDQTHSEPAPSGSLRVSASLRLGRQHLSPILALLGERYPQLDIWLELLDRPVDLLEEGIDIDVRMGEVQEPHLIAHPVKSNVRVLCAAPSYLARRGAPRSLADLAGHECLLLRERHQAFGVWRLQGPQGPGMVKITGSMGSNHADVVYQWALGGKGIVLLAEWDVQAALRSGQLVRLLPDHAQSADVWAVTAARTAQSPKLRLCLQFLIEQLRQGPHALRGLDS